jgi:putative transposase
VARKLRLEYPGAIYHVINRGNYRRDVFESPGAAQSFVTALAEAVARYGWNLQAYVLMRNHFHLVIRTPEPNLTMGMHWLLSTVATRFNRFRSERGHLFQGRYHALPVEDHDVMSHVIDYVHLNPVRAGLILPEQVGAFRWSSLNRFLRGPRFSGMDPLGALEGRGWSDCPECWASYVAHLTRMAADHDEQKRLGYDEFSSGWVIGTLSWRRALARDYANTALIAGLAADEARTLREQRWRKTLDQKLAAAGKSRTDAQTSAETATWKIRLASEVRSECGAGLRWLSTELALGTEGTARSQLSKWRSAEYNKTRPDPI